MLEELSGSVKRMAMGKLMDIEADFRELHRANPKLSFPECVGLYEKEHGVKLDAVHLNHAMKGFDQG